MTPLYGQGWVVHVLGWTLLHFCWQGAAVAGLLWCVLGLMGGRASALRYGASCGALLLMVAAPVVTFWELAVEARRAALHGTLPVVEWVITVVPGGAGGGHWMERFAGELDRATPFVPWIWMAGVMVFLLRLNVGLVLARQMRTVGTVPVEGEWAGRFEELKTRFGVRRVVRLLQTARVEAPAVIGWLRPVVLMPAGCLTRLSTAQVEALLVHELAHIRRHDYLVNVLQSVAEAVLFYHPAVWWVSKQMRLERECRCDALAVEAGGDALGYARALSFLETRRAFLQEVTLGANGGVLTMRIKRLLGVRESSVASQGAAFALLAAVIVLPGGYWATTARAERNTAHVVLAQAGSEAAPAPYQRWVDQDVLWIIAPEEKAAFLSLKSDEERDHFIEQFWSRREAAQSGAKAEHYRRIAYANAHFATSQPGYLSDRGHLYIVMGRPESIDSHPAGAAPYEVWRYGGKDYAFVDGCACGDYRLKTFAGKPLAAVAQKPKVQMARFEPQTAQTPQRISGGVMAGQLISRVDPVYPAEAKSQRIEGTVVLRAVISKEGTIENLQVVSGPKELMGSSIEAVKQWTYKPYLLNGEPTEVDTTITVNYTLGDTASGAPGKESVWLPAVKSVPSSVMAGQLVSHPPPVYPPEAKAKGIQGAVVLRALITREGKVKGVELMSMPSDLDRSAIDAVLQWVYKPYLLNGEPTEVQTTITVNYTLADEHATVTEPKYIGNGVSSPILVHMAGPHYSEEAKKANISGDVLMSLTVDRNGDATHVRVVRGIGYGLDEKAIEAVKQYKFKPAMQDGKPVDVALNIQVDFKIF
jgi:TonB family protein